MKARNLLRQLAGSLSLMMALATVLTACQKQLDRETDMDGLSEPGQTKPDWMEFLKQVDPESGIVLVPNGSSIQDAIQSSPEGGSIYIEPGVYRESLTIDQAGLNIVGLWGDNNEQVVLENPGGQGTAINMRGRNGSVSNVYPKNYGEAGTPIGDLKRSGHHHGQPCVTVNRESLGGGIAHYTFLFKVGEGPYETVRLHRIVKETHPYHPARARSDIFMVHGSIQDFDDIFFTAGSPLHNAETSSPVYLASKGIDVWGIDLAWTLVPITVTDLSFMEDWGIERDVDHVLKGMAFARLVRGLTHQGFGKMNLMGFSYSVRVAYGAAGRETQQHWIARDIDGLIAADGGMKYAPADDEFRQYACIKAAQNKAQLDAAMYADTDGQTFGFLGSLATAAPDDMSPVPGFEVFTNKQVLLFLGSTTYATGNPTAPFWHFVGGDVTGLNYTDYDRWLGIAVSLAPYQPLRTIYENNQCYCDEENVTIDDHLADIKVPILFLGAGGGLGELGEYTVGLTSSPDQTNHVVHVDGKDRPVDFGHADLFMARDAPGLAWEPLRQWLIMHG